MTSLSFFEHEGHKASLGVLYPGMGGPTEYYPKCTCGWIGMAMISYGTLGEFYPTFYYLNNDSHMIKPVYDADGDFFPKMNGGVKETVELVLFHLGATKDEILQKWINEKTEYEISLVTLAHKVDTKGLTEAIDKIELLKTQIGELEGLVFDRDEPLCFTYKTKENQDKIRELAKEIIKERVHQRKEKQPAEEEN